MLYVPERQEDSQQLAWDFITSTSADLNLWKEALSSSFSASASAQSGGWQNRRERASSPANQSKIRGSPGTSELYYIASPEVKSICASPNAPMTSQIDDTDKSEKYYEDPLSSLQTTFTSGSLGHGHQSDANTLVALLVCRQQGFQGRTQANSASLAWDSDSLEWIT